MHKIGGYPARRDRGVHEGREGHKRHIGYTPPYQPTYVRILREPGVSR